MMKKSESAFRLITGKFRKQIFLLKGFRFVSCALFFLKLRGKTWFFVSRFFFTYR